MTDPATTRALAADAATRLSQAVADTMGDDALDSLDAVMEDFATIMEALGLPATTSTEADMREVDPFALTVTVRVTDPAAGQSYDLTRLLSPAVVAATGQPLRQVLARMIRFSGYTLAATIDREGGVL